MVVKVDGPKVERIVENLLANAVRHTPGTDISGEGPARPDGALIEVSDAGRGIPGVVARVHLRAVPAGPRSVEHSPGRGHRPVARGPVRRDASRSRLGGVPRRARGLRSRCCSATRGARSGSRSGCRRGSRAGSRRAPDRVAPADRPPVDSPPHERGGSHERRGPRPNEHREVRGVRASSTSRAATTPTPS